MGNEPQRSVWAKFRFKVQPVGLRRIRHETEYRLGPDVVKVRVKAERYGKQLLREGPRQLRLKLKPRACLLSQQFVCCL
jgi:hypothetical protein